MTEIITALRNMAGVTGSTGADLVTFGQDHIRALLAHIDAQDRTLHTVERWANHHARKPTTTAQEALSVIQHHPAIRAITASYADGAVPDTPDPYAEIERLRADAERYQWLKSQPPSIPANGPELTLWHGDDCGDCLRGDDADAVIDAAMKEAK